MRIGKVMIDTDNMSIEELTTLITEFRKIRARKQMELDFKTRMNELILEAKEHGFTFIDDACGFVREVDDCTLYDERV
jgi:hypothetical protein